MFEQMDCEPEFQKSLMTLKTLLKKSDLVEVHKGRKGGRRANIRQLDYFPEKFTGTARKLKRYLQRLLKYTAQAASDEETRADIISDGPGLNEACVLELEQAAKVPLPGLADIYDETPLSQKKRLLDLLLTYVILFYQDEPSAALLDQRLKGPMLTGLSRLFHTLNTNAATLPAKLMEEYLMRAIGRAENGDGLVLLKSFQAQLRLQKQLEPQWATDDTKHRKILFNCCSLLSQEDNAVQLQSSSVPEKSRGRKIEFVNQAELLAEAEECMQEYTAFASGGDQQQQQQQYKQRQQRTGASKVDPERIARWDKTFNQAPCSCCGSSKHALFSPFRDSSGKLLPLEYVCPCTLFDNWEAAKEANPPYQKCFADPKKFTKAS
jgi:hypothetical protein